MAINWFPGHMAKTIRLLKEDVKMVDAIIEIRDSRIVKSSANPEIENIIGAKPRIIILNKSDLSEDVVTKRWIQVLTSNNSKVIAINSISGEGLKSIKPAIDMLLADKITRMKLKGLVKFTERVMVLGIPNVGKSSFINKIAKNAIAKTGDKPGITRNKQWIKTSIGIELLDTPGILWPRLTDEEVSLNLAYTGAIKDEIMDIQELALNLIDKLKLLYPNVLVDRYKITNNDTSSINILEEIGKRRGAILPGGKIDLERIAIALLDEFRAGKIGRISLEQP